MSNPKLNLYLKELFEHLGIDRPVTMVEYHGNERTEVTGPLYKFMTTHVARKTFITLALANDIPVQEVMRMSGHSDYRGMRPYVSVIKEHIIKISKNWKV
jgi:integrase